MYKAKYEHDDGIKSESSSKFIFNLFDWVNDIIKYLIILGLIMTHLVFISFVNGESMAPTLHDGDVLLLSKFAPARKDIVVIHNPGQLNKRVIKRIIALEGESISFDYQLGKVFINGILQRENYINTKTNVKADWIIPETIPGGHVFVMGDNRNNSTDSRSRYVKFIDKRDISGKVIFRIWPLNRIFSFI